MPVDTILSKIEIQDLTARHFRAIDYGETDAYLATWLPDGELVLGSQRWQGHQTLQKYFSSLAASEGDVRRLVSNFTISIKTNGQATQHCYLVTYSLPTNQLVFLSECNDRLARSNEGWKFAQRIIHSCSSR